MQEHHLKTLLKDYPDIKLRLQQLEKDFSIRPIYFWDETKLGHYGTGWVVEYIILGLTFGAGIAAKSFLEYPFKKLGEATFKATLNFFEFTADKFKRKKSFFFINTMVRNRKITILFDNKMLHNENLLNETYALLEKLSYLIEKEDVFVTDYYSGSFLVKYDSRCKECMIYPYRFDIECGGGSLLITNYGWALLDEPDAMKDPSLSLDNLYLIRAMIHRSLSEYSKSLSYFKKAINANPDNLDVYLEMGNTYFERKNYLEAIECWNKAIRIAEDLPFLSQLYFNVACAMVKLNDMDSATDTLIKALEAGLDKNIILSNPDLHVLRKGIYYRKLQRHL